MEFLSIQQVVPRSRAGHSLETGAVVEETTDDGVVPGFPAVHAGLVPRDPSRVSRAPFFVLLMYRKTE